MRLVYDETCQTIHLFFNAFERKQDTDSGAGAGKMPLWVKSLATHLTACIRSPGGKREQIPTVVLCMMSLFQLINGRRGRGGGREEGKETEGAQGHLCFEFGKFDEPFVLLTNYHLILLLHITNHAVRNCSI